MKNRYVKRYYLKVVVLRNVFCQGRRYFLARLCGIVIMLYNDLTVLCLICVHMERMGGLCAMNHNDQLNSVHILTPHMYRMFSDLMS